MLVLTGDRIILRDHEENDLHEMHAWMSDDEVMRFLPGMKTTSIDETHIRLVESIHENLNPDRSEYFFAVLLKSGEIIGDAGFTLINKREYSGIASMGYFLNSAYWGRGYAVEAANLLIKFAFEELGLHKMTAGCDAENTASERVMIKCGMIKEAHLKRHAFVNGVWRDRLEYATFRE